MTVSSLLFHNDRREYEHRNCIGITRNLDGDFVACLEHPTQYDPDEDQLNIRLDGAPNNPDKCTACGDQTTFTVDSANECTHCRRNPPEDIAPGRVDYSVKEIR